MWKFQKLFSILLLSASTHAATLNCQFDGTPTSGCSTFTLTPVTQINEAISVPGAPFTPYTDTNTTSLSFNPNNGLSFSEFPSSLFNIFTNINSFYSYNMSMTELSTDSFTNCKNLYSIRFQYTNIGNIRAGFARTCDTLSVIEIFDSPIQSIDENAFVGLSNLRSLYVMRNSITCLPSKVFQPLKSLSFLDLSSNNLTAIHSQLFANLGPAMLTIALHNNQITYIPNLNLKNTGVGSRLDILLDSNPIQAIHPLFMTSFYNGRTTSFWFNFNPYNENIKTCIDPNFSQNNANGFTGDLFSFRDSRSNWILQNQTYQDSTTCYSAFTAAMGDDSLITCGSIPTTTTATTLNPGAGSTQQGSGSSPGLGGQCATDKVCRYYLDWSNTYTCVIDGAEGTVTSITGTHYLTYVDTDVTRLYFTNSHLNLVPSILFTKFQNLKYLHIANSGMSVINDQTFNQCGNLELLDASHNNIIHVEETSLRNCTKLRVIDLTGNPIDFVSGGLYELDPSLERIHLNRNSDWILA